MFQVLHRDARTLSDRVAYGLVRLARIGFDMVSGYKHVTIPPGEKMTVEELRKAGHLLDHHAWLSVSCANMLLQTSSSSMPAHSLSRNHCWSSGNGRSYGSSPFKSPAHGENCSFLDHFDFLIS